MKKYPALILTLVLACTLLISSCSTAPQPAPTASPAPAPAPVTSAPAPVPSQAPAVAPKTSATSAPAVIRLKYADQNPEDAWAAQHAAIPSLKAIETATNGRVKIDGYYAQTLCKGQDAWEATKNGVADLAWMYHGFWPNLTPLADVFSLPFLPFKSASQASGIFWKVYEKYPSIQKQFKDNKVLGVWCSQIYFLLTVKKQVKTMEDMKGLKLRTIGGPSIDMMKILGASPVTMAMPDTYLSMQKGVIDGMGTLWEALMAYRQYEVGKYYTYIPLYSAYFTQSMNLDKWNSLPPDIQKQMDGINKLDWATSYGKGMFDDAAKAGPEITKKQGFPMVEYTPPPDEIQKWVDTAGKPLWNDWVKKMNTMGYSDANEILNTILDLIKTYNPPA